MLVIFPVSLVGNVVQYPDAVSLFSNTYTFTDTNNVLQMVAEYTGTKALTAYTPPAPSVTAVANPLTPYEFLMLFTQTERIGIMALQSSNPAVADFMNLLAHATEVDILNPMTIEAVNYLTTVPTSSPVLTAARAAAILS